MKQEVKGASADADHATRQSPNPSVSALRYASVEEERHNLLRSIVAALGDEYDRAQLVVQMPARIPVEPREVWIDDIAAWVRLDGSWCSFDLGRGAFKPTESQALCIRLAAERWEATQSLETQTRQDEG